MSKTYDRVFGETFDSHAYRGRLTRYEMKKSHLETLLAIAVMKINDALDKIKEK